MEFLSDTTYVFTMADSEWFRQTAPPPLYVDDKYKQKFIAAVRVIIRTSIPEYILSYIPIGTMTAPPA